MTGKRVIAGTTLSASGHAWNPGKAELEADVGIPITPDELPMAAINYNPPQGPLSGFLALLYLIPI